MKEMTILILLLIVMVPLSGCTNNNDDDNNVKYYNVFQARQLFSPSNDSSFREGDVIHIKDKVRQSYTAYLHELKINRTYDLYSTVLNETYLVTIILFESSNTPQTDINNATSVWNYTWNLVFEGNRTKDFKEGDTVKMDLKVKKYDYVLVS